MKTWQQLKPHFPEATHIVDSVDRNGCINLWDIRIGVLECRVKAAYKYDGKDLTCIYRDGDPIPGELTDKPRRVTEEDVKLWIDKSCREFLLLKWLPERSRWEIESAHWIRVGDIVRAMPEGPEGE